MKYKKPTVLVSCALLLMLAGQPVYALAQGQDDSTNVESAILDASAEATGNKAKADDQADGKAGDKADTQVSKDNKDNKDADEQKEPVNNDNKQPVVQGLDKLTPNKELAGGAWRQNNTGWWYQLSDGTYPYNTYTQINGRIYYFNGNGYMVTGWQTVNGQTCYFDNSGALFVALIQQDGKTYLYNRYNNKVVGECAVGGKTIVANNNGEVEANTFKVINGNKYYLGVDGSIATGWQKIGDHWYLFDGHGLMVKGWYQSGSVWYHMNDEGIMDTGSFVVNGATYYANASGAMQTGWVRQNDGWHYYSGSGAMHTGWVLDYGTWYHLGANGVMDIYDFNVAGKRYYADASGAMQTGWIHFIDGAWRYYYPSGAMVTGWLDNGGTWYYLDPESGVMKTGFVNVGDRWYYCNASGAMQTGWIHLGSKWYYFKGSGELYRGWLQDGGVWYYLLPSTGEMVVGEHTIDGKKYQFGGSGQWVDPRNYAAQNLWRTRGMTSKTNYLMLVDTEACHTMIYRREGGEWAPLYDWLCSPGAYRTPTVKGTYTINSKGLSFGRGFTCWYWSSFYGDYLFHSVTYYPGSKTHIMEGKLGYHLSHGCVRLDINNAKWIYDNIPIGTKVYIW